MLEKFIQIIELLYILGMTVLLITGIVFAVSYGRKEIQEKQVYINILERKENERSQQGNK